MTPLLDPDEAAALLSVSRRWLEKRVAARVIPHTRLGALVRFTEEQVEEIAAAGAVQPLRSVGRRSA